MDEALIMPSYEEFRQEVNRLRSKGCSFDKAFDDALNKYPQLAAQADAALIMRQRLKREDKN